MSIVPQTNQAQENIHINENRIIVQNDVNGTEKFLRTRQENFDGGENYALEEHTACSENFARATELSVCKRTSMAARTMDAQENYDISEKCAHVRERRLRE
ncbi:hypothetical protein PoB_004240000 [Plakobranchus ocellatus]|uniref:Uncharacterized protein n=1 Tax=Plakobranchus ocellatus TaxID=259542 RepID=A0AAV4B5P1_9GAST|nr:hypothetical protein PoB_004240000 [Plakobranchus ocellatus]